jgi:hypothetical protein
MAHRVVRAPLRMAASGRSRPKKYLGGPRVRRGRALSRGQATARPSPRAVSAHSGHDRSAKKFDGIHYAHFHDANNQDWSHCRLHAAPLQPHQLISGRAPSARTKILHTRGSSAPRWMGLVSRTADKANPASSVTMEEHPKAPWFRGRALESVRPRSRR